MSSDRKITIVFHDGSTQVFNFTDVRDVIMETPRDKLAERRRYDADFATRLAQEQGNKKHVCDDPTQLKCLQYSLKHLTIIIDNLKFLFLLDNSTSYALTYLQLCQQLIQTQCNTMQALLIGQKTCYLCNTPVPLNEELSKISPETLKLVKMVCEQCLVGVENEVDARTPKSP